MPRGVAGWREGELAEWAATKARPQPIGPSKAPCMFELAVAPGGSGGGGGGIGIEGGGGSQPELFGSQSRVDLVRNRVELLRQRRPMRRKLKLVETSAEDDGPVPAPAPAAASGMVRGRSAPTLSTSKEGRAAATFAAAPTLRKSKLVGSRRSKAADAAALVLAEASKMDANVGAIVDSEASVAAADAAAAAAAAAALEAAPGGGGNLVLSASSGTLDIEANLGLLPMVSGFGSSLPGYEPSPATPAHACPRLPTPAHACPRLPTLQATNCKHPRKLT